MRGFAAICIVVALIALGGPVLSATQQDYDACSRASDLDLGIKACTRIVDDQAEAVVDRVLAYLQRGNMYSIRGDLERASTDYGEAIKLDPKNVLAYSSRAITNFRKGDRERAIADYREADMLDPAKIREMTIANAELKEIASAAALGNASSPVGANAQPSPEWQSCTGNSRVDRDLQITACTALIQSDRETAQNRAIAHRNRGVAYELKKESDLAIVDLNEAIRLDPNFAAAYNDRGNVYNRRGDNVRAIMDYDESIRLNPVGNVLAAAYVGRGLAYDSLGKLDSAIADYTEAIRVDPINHDAYNDRGIAHNRQGTYGKAIADFNEALRLRPNFWGSHYGRGVAFAGRQDYDRAIADLEEAIRLDSRSQASHEELARARKAKNDLSRENQAPDASNRTNRR